MASHNARATEAITRPEVIMPVAPARQSRLGKLTYLYQSACTTTSDALLISLQVRRSPVPTLSNWQACTSNAVTILDCPALSRSSRRHGEAPQARRSRHTYPLLARRTVLTKPPSSNPRTRSPLVTFCIRTLCPPVSTSPLPRAGRMLSSTATGAERGDLATPCFGPEIRPSLFEQAG